MALGELMTPLTLKRAMRAQHRREAKKLRSKRWGKLAEMHTWGSSLATETYTPSRNAHKLTAVVSGTVAPLEVTISSNVVNWTDEQVKEAARQVADILNRRIGGI